MAPKTTRSATKKTKSPLDKNGHDVTGQPHLTAPGFKYNKDNSPEGLQVSMRNHLKFTLARDPETATMRDWWTSSALAARDRIMERFIKTMDVHNEANTKRVYYLSLEYLMGRLYKNNLYNSGLYQAMCEAAQLQDIDIHAMEREERDMGLGNGGLGRLAACFLDSLATLDLPAVGYGIRYEYGLFRQEFVNGYQIEHPDNWQQAGDPWEICRPEYTQKVRLYGRVEHRFNDKGDFSPEWVPAQVIEGVPYDIPICGYGAETVNFLRLWEAKASQEFDLQVFNRGDYVEAVREKAMSETVSKVLYPNDTSENGKELRLVQQYFFVCCSLHDIIRRFLKKNSDWRDFPSKCAIQLNDTHPAIAVPELMRIFIDEIKLDWNEAWEICRQTFAYTNHTLLPEALEKWSVPLLERVLPRHMQIIYEINQRYIEDEVACKWPGDDQKKRDLSLIEEGHPKMVRMAYLSVVASHAVNGVAALHTQLLRQFTFADFNALYPNKLQNKTNGITPRRWLLACNPDLSNLISKTLDDDKEWPRKLDKLRELEKHADDKGFQETYMEVKRRNKERVADWVSENMGVTLSTDAIYDTQIKRIHEYKRQHLNLLHILTLYRRILHDHDYDMYPRVFIVAGKAAPGYELAKNIIRAINKVGERINHDPRVRDRIKVIFPENYGVSVAEVLIPGTDVSEQISTAGKEASGTGNMKLALNGAVTIGTLDGANVEIQEEAGEDNVVIFGKTVEEIAELRNGHYSPWDHYNGNEELKAVIDWLASDYFTPGERNAFAPLQYSLLDGGDPFFVLADYAAYVEAQQKIDTLYRDKAKWAKMAIMNTARMGKFSSDRTIQEYADQIWGLEALRVPR